MANTHKIRKVAEDPLAKLERTIGEHGEGLPTAQTGRGLFLVVDAPTFEGEENRAGSKARTLRRRTKIEKLFFADVINKREAEACEWYATRHAARYDVLGVTARYGEQGGGGLKNYCHGPKTREQESAYHDYEFARAGINPRILPMFERVVLYGRPLGKLALTFRLAARQLLARLEGRGVIGA